MQPKTQIRLKFYLHKILQLKKSVNAQGFLILPSFDCFTPAQEKLIERELINRGIIKLLKKGGEWNDEGHFFNKNHFEVDWNQLDVDYNGWLKEVKYVDLPKEWSNQPIAVIENAEIAKRNYLKDEDLVINPHINKRIPNGLTPQNLLDCLDAKYYLKTDIDEMLKEVNPHLVVENKGEFKLEIEGDILRKVSYRVTNSLVSLKKSDGSRARFLEKSGLKKQINGDIKSEIPRVTRLIHTGEWLPFSFDFYSQYFGQERIRPEAREFVKAQAMPLYFTKWKSPQAFSNRQFLGLDEKYKGQAENQTRRILEKMKEGFDREVGESLNSSIFLYTSWLETKALQILVRKFPNARFFQVYDEIFASEDCGDLELVYKEAALALYARIRSVTLKIKEEEDYKVTLLLTTNKGNTRDNLCECLYGNVTLVSKIADLKSSSLIFEDKNIHYRGNKNAAGPHKKYSEETKAKMRVPKSEETKAKISETMSETLNKQVDFTREIMQSPTYINNSKKREKQQYIDKCLVKRFGDISSTTLTKIRKLATSANKE